MRTLTATAALPLVLVASTGGASVPERHKGARIAWVRGVAAERCVGLAGLEEDVKSRLGYDRPYWCQSSPLKVSWSGQRLVFAQSSCFETATVMS